MVTASNVRPQYLVVDTGGFLRVPNFDKYQYEHVCSVNGVVNEIRDEVSRRQLQFQPTHPEVLSPTSQDVAFVKRFAKQTGDFAFLSETDVQLIALTYMLQRSTGDVSRLKSKPSILIQRKQEKTASRIVCNHIRPKNSSRQTTVQQHPPSDNPEIHAIQNHYSHKSTPSATEEFPNNDFQRKELHFKSDHQAPIVHEVIDTSDTTQGFNTKPSRPYPVHTDNGETEATLHEHSNAKRTDEALLPKGAHGIKVAPNDDHTNNASPAINALVSSQYSRSSCSSIEYSSLIAQASSVLSPNEGTVDNASEFTYSDSSENGWINQDNFHSIFGSQSVKDVEQTSAMRVACMTTDFTMQNVLIQMGLNVISIDGYRIRETKHWVLLCRACRSVTWDTMRKFCHSCGNNTVYRAAATLSANGNFCIEDHRPRFNPRGKIYSIPKPKGGRQGDLILCEDQMFIGNRDRLLRHHAKQLEKEKLTRDPFNLDNAYEQNGWWARDTSRCIKKTLRIGMGPGNPNSNRWQKRRTKK